MTLSRFYPTKSSFCLLTVGKAIALCFDLRDRYPSNHRIGMVEMDKIVSAKRCWVFLFQPNLIDYLMRLLWRLST